VIEVEVFGEELAPGAPAPAEVRRLCDLVAERLGVRDGHVAIEFVGERRIAELNAGFRAKPEPTDVLSFPIDGAEPISTPAASPAGAPGVSDPGPVPRELGDVIICPAHTVDVREAIVHGMLHLLGMDHESDNGEMLALQDELLARSQS
jgi:probable rRNA maturation factor